MAFSSMTFLWLFFPAVLIVGMCIRRTRAANVFLLLASLFFYAWGDIGYFPLLIALILGNWGLGLAIGAFRGRRPAAARFALILSVLLNLGALGYYKYANFFLNTLDHLVPAALPRVSVALPVGISFFVFQALTYTIDLYRGRFEVQRDLFDFALYMSFFPRVMSGPIIRYAEFGEQLRNRPAPTLSMAAEGMRRFLYGLGKKVLIADALGVAADRIFGMDLARMNGAAAWLGALFYTLQLYYDFSGYSDSAIGLARMFGFRFPENFDYPYLSRSVTEFWRRWHITLGAWFREYLYIPLGGNRKGAFRTYLNLFLVFAATGLWHGASWNFVGWGVYNAFFVIIERMGLRRKVLERYAVLGHVYGILTFMVGWVFFRVESLSQGLEMVKRMFLPWLYRGAEPMLGTMISTQAALICLLAIPGAGILQRMTQSGKGAKLAERWKNSAAEAVFLAAVLLLCFVRTAGGSYNAFIYTKF